MYKIQVHVSYEYNGISYDDVYWKLVSSENKYSINETVNLEIFKSKPNVIVEPSVAVYIGWIFPLVVTIAEFLLAGNMLLRLIRKIKSLRKKQSF